MNIDVLPQIVSPGQTSSGWVQFPSPKQKIIKIQNTPMKTIETALKPFF